MHVVGSDKLETITLGKDSIQFDRRQKLSPQAIVRISHTSQQAVFRVSHTPARALGDPALTCQTLHFAEKGALGKKVWFCASPANVATIFQYLQQAGSLTMRWD